MGKQRKFCLRKTVLAAVAALAVLAGCLTGCGGEDAGGGAAGREEKEAPGEADGQGSEDFVYVPEFQTAALPEQGGELNFSPAGDKAWCLLGQEEEGKVLLWQKALGQEGAEEQIALAIEPLEGCQAAVEAVCSYPEGGYVCFLGYVGEDGETARRFLCRYDREGAPVFRRDITEAVGGDGQSSRIRQVLAGPEGTVYGNYGSLVRIFSGEDGNLLRTVFPGEKSDSLPKEGSSAGENLSAGENSSGEGDGLTEAVILAVADSSLQAGDLALSREGKVYLSYWDVSRPEEGLLFQEISPDPEFTAEPKGGLGDVRCLSTGGFRPSCERGFLIGTGSGLIEYDPETESVRELLKWTDIYVSGETVRFVQGLEGGRILVYTRDGESRERSLVYLTLTQASQVPQREEIVIGAYYGSDSALQRLAAGFNRTNEKYRVVIRPYIDESAPWTETVYSDAQTAMNNELASGKGPDILELSYVAGLGSYAAKGVLEDLSPYLGASTALKREDFLENVLEGCTLDGKLIAIPKYFTLNTLMGRTSQVGERDGWTLEDVMELSDQYPQAQVIPYTSKSYILKTLVSYGSDTYIDYAAGECRFDSPEFIRLLEFTDRFSQSYAYDEDFSLLREVQEGNVLLQDLYLSGLTEYQMYCQVFGEPVTLIGYPTGEGERGNMLRAGSLYAMVSTSRHKEGAWAVLEYVLRYEKPGAAGASGFPSRKDMLEEMLEAAMEKTYVLDENGEPVRDEKGEPIEEPRVSWNDPGFSGDIYAATAQQVQAVRAAILSGRVVFGRDETVSAIIGEEAQAYFDGQKTAQETAEVIQSRVQLYISENR